jgi:hypothetical protein
MIEDSLAQSPSFAEVVLFAQKNFNRNNLVMNKPLENLLKSVFPSKEDYSDSDIAFAMSLDILSTIPTFTVSAQATRRTEVQYCSNNYFASTALDLQLVAVILQDQLRQVADQGIIAMYERHLEIRTGLFTYLSAKHEAMDHFLRSRIENAVEKDGLENQGRFR